MPDELNFVLNDNDNKSDNKSSDTQQLLANYSTSLGDINIVIEVKSYSVVMRYFTQCV